MNRTPLCERFYWQMRICAHEMGEKDPVFRERRKVQKLLERPELGYYPVSVEIKPRESGNREIKNSLIEGSSESTHE